MKAKEMRLLNYLARCEERKHTPTIGDMCRACCTTPLTLLTKTIPALEEYARWLNNLCQTD
jgi:hypothetical protein